MDITEDQLREVFVNGGRLFGVEVKLNDIPHRLIEKILPLMKDFLLTENTALTIKFSLRIESMLESFLKEKAPKPEFLNKVARNYESKVSLALLLGLPAQHENSLRVVGKIRNRFAHDADATLEQDLMDALYSSFSSGEKDFIIFFFDKIRKIDPSLMGKKAFRDVSAIDQFKFMIMILWISLYASTDSDIAC